MAFNVKNSKPLVDPARIAEFTAGADRKPNLSYWDSLDDKRKMPSFVMRFTERDLMMLKRIAETTPHSMHEFCYQAIRKTLNESNAISNDVI